jgi:hypothetical protein
MTFGESQRFFHGEADSDDFLGRAWRRTTRENAPISWEVILKAYSDQTGQDLGQLKALICV